MNNQLISNRHGLYYKIFNSNEPGAISFVSCFLGIVIGVSMTLYISYFNCFYLSSFMLYVILLAYFHFFEGWWCATYNKSQFTTDSFLINHSREYSIAVLVSFMEYHLEWAIMPSVKNIPITSLIGFVLSIFGLAMRSTAMIYAQHNFTHLVQFEKREEHELVTTGVYAIVRHPGYCGWFWWSVGSQILLCNYICIIGYFYVSWNFFKDRIQFEEQALVEFFGDSYIEYRRRVSSGIPFIK